VNRIVVEIAEMGGDPTAGVPPSIFIQLREPPGISGGDPFRCELNAPEFTALRSLAVEPNAVRRAGEALFEALKSPKTLDAITAALQIQPPDTRPVYLDIGRNASLHQLPWEALFAPNRDFLALDARWPVGRIVSGPRTAAPVLSLEPPLRIAAVLSCLGVPAAEEWDALRNALQPAGQANKARLLLFVSEDDLYTTIDAAALPWVEVAPVPSEYADLQSRIAGFRPHVLHFFCHGSSSWGPHLEVAVASDWVVGRPENSHTLEPKGIRELTAATEDFPWLIVLNACESAVAGDADTGAQSVAVALVHDGVPAVVGMREPVLSTDAACFTDTFYASLLDALDSALTGAERELTVDWPALAVAARAAMCRNRNGMTVSAAAAQMKEWTLPVIHVRLAPFVVHAADATHAPPPRSEQLESTIIDTLLAALPGDTPEETVRAFRDELQSRTRANGQ
jgi:hypothetical protein